MIYAIFSILLVGARAQTPGPQEKVFDLPQVSQCGLITRFAPNQIPPQCVQQSLNITYDGDGSIERRQGQSQYNATGCSAYDMKGLWNFKSTAGTQYLVGLSHGAMYYLNNGNCSAISGLSGLSTTADMECTATLGRIWCTDGVDPVFSWDGTSTETITGAPLGSLIGTFRNRILIGNVPGALTTLYLSGEENGEDWSIVIPSLSTNAATIDISGTNDGYPITCLMGQFQDAFYIGRDYDLYALFGYSLTDFTLRKINNETGCVQPKSVQSKDGSLFWLSHTGIEQLNGATINRVSDNIRPLVSNIINAEAQVSEKVFTTQEDWQGGSSNACASGPNSCMSTTISPGDVVPSSSTFVDNTTSTFVNGTLVNVSTASSNSMQLSISTNFITGGTFTNASLWNVVGTIEGSFTASIANGTTFQGSPVQCPGGASYCAAASDTNGYCFAEDGAICFYDGNTNASLGGYALSASNNAIYNLSKIAISSSVFVSLGFGTLCPPNDGSAKTISAQPVGFNLIASGLSYCSGTYRVNTFANVYISSYSPSGSYTSPVLDTTFSTATLDVPQLSFSSNSIAGITFQQENSADNSTWSSPSTLTPGSQATGGSRYWRYIENFTTSNGTMTPTSNGLNELDAETTGYYITDCVNTTGMSSWQNFNADYQNNGGNVAFYLTTGNSCAAVTSPTASWTSQLPNSQITLATAAYTAGRFLFTMTSATNTPTVNDVQWSWSSGGGSPEVASVFYPFKDEYWLFFTSSTLPGAHNDHVLVLDQNMHWTLYDDVNAESAAILNNNPYIGDANLTGLVYEQDVSQADFGNPYTMLLQTADVNLGEPTQRKLLKTLYLDLNTATANIPINVSYNIDGSTTSYSLGTVNLATEQPMASGYYEAKLPFPVSQDNIVHWVSITLSAPAATGPLKVYGMRFVYEPLSWK